MDWKITNSSLVGYVSHVSMPQSYHKNLDYLSFLIFTLNLCEINRRALNFRRSTNFMQVSQLYSRKSVTGTH